MRGVVAASALVFMILTGCFAKRFHKFDGADVLVAHPDFKKFEIVYRQDLPPDLIPLADSVNKVVREKEQLIRTLVLKNLSSYGIAERHLRRMDFSYYMLDKGQNTLILRYLLWLDAHKIYAAVAVFVELNLKDHKIQKVYIEPLPLE